MSRVVDGDTFEGYIDNGGNPGVNPLAIELNRLTIRICGIDAHERRQYYGDVATRYLNYRIGGETVQLELIRKDEQTGTRPLQITKKVYICQTTQRTIPRNWALGSFVSRLWGCAGKYGSYLFVKMSIFAIDFKESF